MEEARRESMGANAWGRGRWVVVTYVMPCKEAPSSTAAMLSGAFSCGLLEEKEDERGFRGHVSCG